MNGFRGEDWAASAVRESTITAPFLMSTGVLTGGAELGNRPVATPHAHPEAMLAWCYRGTVWVYLEDAMWRLGPGEGVWLPPRTAHTARHERDAVGCYTYIADGHLAAPVAEVRRARVPRAVQEMMLHLGINDMEPGLRVRMQGVVLELLQQPAPPPLPVASEIPVPGDDRVRSLVESVLARPGDSRTARELCAQHGLHERTVLRVFSDDIGMSFGQWRTGVRMAEAARLIVGGTPVGLAGQRCGYDSTSAFSAAFKGRFGVTPRQYIAQARADASRREYWR